MQGSNNTSQYERTRQYVARGCTTLDREIHTDKLRTFKLSRRNIEMSQHMTIIIIIIMMIIIITINSEKWFKYHRFLPKKFFYITKA